MKLFISEPEERHQGAILVHDEALNDIAEFYHNEHATVGQSYETALALAQKLVTPTEPQEVSVREALENLLQRIDDHFGYSGTKWDWKEQADARAALSLSRPELGGK